MNALERSSRVIRLSRKEFQNKKAIQLLQSWIDEAPDNQQSEDLARLKEEIDSQRLDDRKLFK